MHVNSSKCVHNNYLPFSNIALAKIILRENDSAAWKRCISKNVEK